MRGVENADNGAMSEEWITFPKLDERAPKVVLALARPHSRADSLPVAAIARLAYEAGPNGLPGPGELPRLAQIEEQIEQSLTPLGFVHAGHYSADGEMKSLFYGPGLAPKSVSVKVGLLRKVDVALESREDPDWRIFGFDLQASPVEYEISHNRTLLDCLAGEGDVANLPRPVDFTVLLPSSEARRAFLNEITEAGYVRPAEDSLWETDEDFLCEIKFETTVETVTIAERCAYLRSVAKKHGGDLDGWACHVTN